MVLAGLITEAIFTLLHLVPQQRRAIVVETSVQLNYTTVLNITFLAIAALLAWCFYRTGGPAMMNMMELPADGMAHDHCSHHTP